MVGKYYINIDLNFIYYLLIIIFKNIPNRTCDRNFLSSQNSNNLFTFDRVIEISSDITDWNIFLYICGCY